jgi:DNA polymerase III subunit delta'
VVTAIGPDGQLPLPWLAQPLQHALQTQKGHALLIHGPQGIGQFELTLALAQTWLCEVKPQKFACGQCASCRLVQSQTHPDLLVLLPEALRERLGWGAADAGEADKPSKAKPSKEIKTEAVRGAVNFSQTTTSQGGVKVVIVHPAERMNAIAANTLLKTLEEPPGRARFILSCAAPQTLLPTIRSRCQAVPMVLPPSDVALTWLASHKVAQPEVMLAACGGQPLEALQWIQEGVDAAGWMRLPRQLAAGDVGQLASWPLPRLVDALQKFCHDVLCVAHGAPPRYFPPPCVPKVPHVQALHAWAKMLAQTQRQAEHPWNLPLMVESLVLQARGALSGQSGSTLAAK